MKKTKNAFVFALKGLQYAFVNERNFKIEIFCAVAVCIAGFVLRISTIEWLVVIMNIGFVLSVELVNTAIEKLCDVITKEINPTIKIIKDVAAAAVLLAAVMSIICALIIFVPLFLKIINQ
jgi:undecaprenol kinase